MSEYTEASLTEAIFRKWPMEQSTQPRYIVAVQVNSGAGFQYRRTLDAIVFDTWPSAGLHLHGLEIKTTKADLRRELQNPGKFGDWARHLDFFSIVAPLGIADLNLLPPRWGLYCPDAEGNLRARRKPIMLHDGSDTILTINRSMAAAYCRALVVRSISKDARRAEYDRGFANGKSTGDIEAELATSKVSRYEEAIKSFEEKSGVKLSTYSGGAIGEAVNVVLHGGIEQRIGYAGNVRGLGERLIKLADELDELKESYSQ